MRVDWAEIADGMTGSVQGLGDILLGTLMGKP